MRSLSRFALVNCVAACGLTALVAQTPAPQAPAPQTAAPQAPAPKVEPNQGGEVDLASQDLKVALERMHPAEGYAINLFASEQQFPDIANPLAMTFDAGGRLWVLTSPTYPHLLPGVAPTDKIVILEDTNRDGQADRLTTFADGLYLPMGFELGDGGVYVSQQPNLMFLRDTNGDGRADERRIVLHGFGTEDSHHAIHAFTWGPDGALYFQEGTFFHTQVETPYGPVRLQEAGVFRYEPRSEKLSVFVSYGFANPWGHVIDRWGQNFISDASNGNNYYGTAFSGRVDYPRKQKTMKEWTLTKVRPTAGVEFIRSRQFPDDAQGNFLINNVIGFHGIKQYKVTEDGSGFVGTEVAPLLQSSDTNFRPVALQFGPDGALYLVDWFNPLVGHMQYSIRDARRDKAHGRIYRIVAKNRPLLEPARIDGQSVAAQLDLLKAYEDRVRYRARRALRDQPKDAVIRAVGPWVAGLDARDPEYQHNLLEGLWVYQAQDVVEPALLKRLLAADDYHARAAAVRVLQLWFDRVDGSMTLLKQAIQDPAPRVRLEAVRALSFVSTAEAATTALDALRLPMDDYLRYTLESTMTTLDRFWRPEVTAGRAFTAANPAAHTYLLGLLKPVERAPLAVPPAEPGMRRVTISAVKDQMKFDTARFTARPGETFEIVFTNPDEMPHNLVILAPGRLDSVGQKAEAMAAQPDGFQKNFIPDTTEVLFATKLVNQNEIARLRVTAPNTPGNYPFACTFPAHWRVMNGVMEVVKQ